MKKMINEFPLVASVALRSVMKENAYICLKDIVNLKCNMETLQGPGPL